ncbi:MAG: response regulator [Leptospira sp.]|nr:response regulator [Leptospira sp.]
MGTLGISKSGRQHTVIIADGSKFQSKQLQQIFESEEFKIIGIAETGRQLVDLYRANKTVSLITIEINMPVMDGYAAFWEIKELGTMPRILFISDESTPALIKNVLENGAMDYIVKPLKREKILEKVKPVMERIPI